MDRDFLHLAEDEIQRLALPSVALLRGDEGFTLEGLAEGETADAKAIDSLVSKVAGLSFATVEGKGAEALARVDEPELTVEIERKDAPTVTYRLGKEADGEDYLLAASTADYLFRVKDYTVKPLLEASRDKLIEKPAEDESGTSSLDDPPGGVGDNSG